MRRFLLASMLVSAAPLAAQSGTTVWSMRVKVADTLQAKVGGISEVDMRMTLATDGSRLGMQLEFGEAMAAAVPGMDFSMMRIQAVMPAGGDSVSVGIILPPEIAAQMGGGIGLRIDAAIPDSITGANVPNIDSMMTANQGEEPRVVNTGRSATVAGIACEEWEVTPQGTDSLPYSGAMHLCLADDVPALHAFTSLIERALPDFGFDFGKMKELGRRWFGGRDLVAIRTIMGDNQDIVVQLETSSNTAPDASFFVLPDGLQPFPMEMIKAFTTGMQQGASREEP